VNKWIETGDFTHPEDAVPPAVYLPDGHRVPICVILAADGRRCLAQLWDSAWKERGGDSNITHLGAIDETTFENLYRDPDFLHSYTLDAIGPILSGANGGVGSGSPATTKQQKKAAKKK
jgi:hypothetical protein